MRGKAAPSLFFTCAIMIAGPVKLAAQVTLPAAYVDPTINYIRTWDAMAPEQTPNTLMSRDLRDVKQTTVYYDGLGQPLQTVVKQGSLKTGQQAVDLVMPVVYDEFGRETYKYLPFAANNTGANSSLTDGLFKLNPFQQDSAFNKNIFSDESYYYSKTEFEASPLNRVSKLMAPGNSWVGASRGVETKYWINATTDSVRLWRVTDVTGGFGTYASDSMYPAGRLYKNVTVDEHGKQVVEFKDKSGLVILKKVQLTAQADTGTGKGPTGWLCTYYIYDDLSNLRCVIQPRGVELLAAHSWNMDYASGIILKEQCFRYEYDRRNRLIHKKVPGAGIVWMVYDTRDRLVMTQDSTMRSNHQWLYTQYDGLNRPAATGIITDNSHYNDLSYHQTRADTSTAYPKLSDYTYTELTHTFYDTYDWLNDYTTGLTSTLDATGSGSGNEEILTASSTNWPYPQAISQSNQLRGLVTGTRIKVLGAGSDYLYTVNFYDDKSRVIQVQSTNVTGGIDIGTTQYSWNGKPLLTIQKQRKAGINAQTILSLTKYTYDSLWRLSKLQKKVSHSQVNDGNMPDEWTTILENEYDPLGQLSKKRLAPEYNDGAGLDSLSYDYNIRGWTLGMNRDYVKDTTSTSHYFGFDLGYDKDTIHINSLAKLYTHKQYNGNIGGMLWKSTGDDELRKYDFTYDAANRILTADFNQFTNTSFSKDAGMDFSLSGMSYDANGNILRMDQRGWKIGGSETIDSLLYTYIDNSNKLLNVLDRKNDTATHLGDFRSSKAYMTALSQSKTISATDYSYDGNGNLSEDKNKDIETIHYNHLNLPDSIRVTDKGYIKYTYDASGNKLKKTVYEPGVDTTITLYLGGAVFKNDTLEFISQEEGRVRKPDSLALVYDYMLKDHLGNVRMLLTTEQKTDKYPVASLETAKIEIEKGFYTIDTTRIVLASTVTGLPTYHNDNGIGNNPEDESFETANSQRLYKLNATTNKTGLGITLKVMAGDTLDIFGRSYWHDANTGGSTANIAPAVLDILSGLLGSPTSVTTNAHTSASELDNITTIHDPVSNFIGQTSRDDPSHPQRPKAFINYIFLDEQFQYVGGGASAVNNTSGAKDHYEDLQNLVAAKNGYVYIYCSNESPVNVFFDNLQVMHRRGRIVEETHYYPFGLTQVGISSKALAFGQPENRIKYNGIEKENDLEISIYDAQLRELDGQVGRWWQLDPKIENMEIWSPYTSNYDNPIRYNDPKGDEPQCCVEFFKGVRDGFANGWKDTKSFVKSLGTAQGWKNLVNGLNNVNPMGVMTPQKTLWQQQTGDKVVNVVKNIPNMSSYDVGHAVGYGGEKALETVLVSKGAGVAKNAINTVGSTTLFRAASAAEITDATANGVRSMPGNATYEGKLFAANAPDAAQYGKNNFGLDGVPNTVMKVKVPNSVMKTVTVVEADGMQAVHIPENQLPKVKFIAPLNYSPKPSNPFSSRGW